jgi:ATP-dependent exoDNAse (exonuclease V) beta subunit
MSKQAGQGLSQSQRAAVERSGQDVCVSAGPGSGKTFVLVERFSWLVRQGLDPLKILAITFTEKAATNIKRRLADRFAGDAERRRAIERAPVSTIHSFCTSILREHAIAAGVDPGFGILDEREAWIERQQALKSALDAVALGRREDFRQLLDVWRYGKSMEGAILSVYESIRMYGGPKSALANLPRYDSRGALDAVESAVKSMLEADPPCKTDKQREKLDALREWLIGRPDAPPLEWLRGFGYDMRGVKLPEGHPFKLRRDTVKDELIPAARSAIGGEATHAQRELLRDILILFDENFRAAKRSLGMLDFTDLEEYALAVLQNDADVRAQVQERYDAVLMDELQDTNPIQWRIVNLVRRPRLFFAVGDINQSIYGFRQADPRNFEGLQEEFEQNGWPIDRLETNYRSREEILRVANAITSLDGIQQHTLQAREEPFPAKRIPSVELQRVEGDDTEADWIAHRIRELHSSLLVGNPPRRARFSDFAVLTRNTGVFAALESALQRQSVPYVVTRGGNYFDLQEVIDLTNWLRVLENPCDEIATYALLRSPFFGFSDEDLHRRRINGQLIPAEARTALDAIRALREDLPPDLLLTRALDEAGYRNGLNPAQSANVDKFLALLRGLRSNGIASLAAIIEQIDGLREAGTETAATPPEESDSVKLLSIHGAKGLEFPVVFLASIQKASGQDDYALTWVDGGGFGGSWRLDGEAAGVLDPAARMNKSIQKVREERESDRMLYVAITRAEEHLVLSWRRPDGRTGRSSPWPQIVEGALEPDWPAEENSAEEAKGQRVIRRRGIPEPLDPPEGESSSDGAVELVPVPVDRQAGKEIFVTALVRFESCPRRYFLGTSLRWPAERPGVGGGAELGTEVHALLAGEVLDKPTPEALRLQREFEQSELGRRAARATRMEREYDFLVDLDGVLIAGQIDLWFEEGGEIVLVDYKVGKKPEPEKLAEYEKQLQIYSVAVERATKQKPARAVLTFLHSREVHEVDLDCAAEKAGVLVQVWQQAESSGEYELVESKHCESCPYFRTACPSGWNSSPRG